MNDQKNRSALFKIQLHGTVVGTEYIRMDSSAFQACAQPVGDQEVVETDVSTVECVGTNQLREEVAGIVVEESYVV